MQSLVYVSLDQSPSNKDYAAQNTISLLLIVMLVIKVNINYPINRVFLPFEAKATIITLCPSNPVESMLSSNVLSRSIHLLQLSEISIFFLIRIQIAESCSDIVIDI